jgi:hypothetical protein
MKYVNVLAMAAIGLLTTLTLSACAPALVSSWKAPDAAPFRLVGDKVAAVVMATDETTRRAGEDALARQLSLRGAEGIPMYTLLPEAEPDDEAKARAAAEQAGVVGVVVMRPVRVDKEISSNPVTYSGPIHGGFWGGYYGHGWGNPWGPGVVSGGEIRTDTIVTVETLVYGLRENKLLWRGQSETTNPRNVNRLIEDTAEQVVNELARLELISGSVRASTG